MRHTLYLFLIISLILTSCKKSEEKLKAAISLDESEVALTHNDEIISNFHLNARIIGVDSLLAFDGKISKFVLFDLNRKALINIYPIQKVGPSFMDFPIIESRIRGKLLYVLSRSYFSIFQLDGTIIKRFSSDDFEGLFEDYSVSGFQFFSESKIIFTHTPKEYVYGRDLTNIVSKNIFSVFDLQSETIETLPITAPTELRNAKGVGYFQDYARPSFLVVSEKIIYSYPYSSKIYIYNMETDELNTKTPNTTLVDSTRPPFPSDQVLTSEWLDYTYSSVKYSALQYDEKTKKYVQVAAQFFPSTDGKKQNKKFILVYDQELNLELEQAITERIMEPAYVSNGTIYLVKSLPVQSQESASEYVTYTIKASDKP